MSYSRVSAFIATSLRREDEDINRWFADLLKSFAIEPIFGDEPETETIPEKIRKQINEHPIFIAILSKRDKLENGKWIPPEWVNNEIGIAFGYRKKIIAFIEEDVVTEGITPYITNYVRFDRTKLLKSMPEIVKIILTIYKNEIDEIRYFPLRNLQTLIVGLESLYRYFSHIKILKYIEKEVSERKIYLSGIYVKNKQLTTIIKGGSNDTSLQRGVNLRINKKLKIGEDEIIDLIATTKIYAIQEKLSQGRFTYIKDSSFYETYIEDDGLVEVENTSLSVIFPEGTDKISLESIEGFLIIIDEFIQQGKKALEAMSGELFGNY